MKFIKKNKMLILALLTISYFGFRAISTNIKEYNENVAANQYSINKCNKDFKNDKIMLDDCIENIYIYKRADAYNLFQDIIFNDHFMIMQYLLPFLILMCSIEGINKKLKSGFLKYELNRKKYKDIIIKEWLKSIRYLLIIPFVMLVFFFISYLLSSGNLDFKSTLELREPMLDPIVFKNIPKSILISLTNFFIHGLFIINIGYIVTIKGKNYILSLLTSYIVYFGLWLLSEAIGGYYICKVMLKLYRVHNYFSFSTIWSYGWIDNIPLFTLYMLLLTLSSFIVLIIAFKNKEKVLLANE